MLAAPEDASARLTYAEWLEKRRDPRGEFLRIESEAERLRSDGTTDSPLERRLRELSAALDPAWLAVVTTLGRGFRTVPWGSESLVCAPSHLPFTEAIGMRGRIITFASQFRGERSWQPNVANDLQLLCELELDRCFYGAAHTLVHPFICELRPKRGPLTGADVIAALKARNFRSRYIRNLDAQRIAYPGYHPGDGKGFHNDDIHNDFSAQAIFENQSTNQEVNQFSGTHGVLKRSVVDGQLWYALLHTTPQQVDGFDGVLYSNYVILFAVGRSLHGDRLLGVVTHQVCHNLCD
jgi:uncharacterized protein (TIGR02996 family)